MRPVRPSGTPTTDSSSAPGEQPPPSFEGGVACRRRTVPNRRGAGSSQPNDSGAAAKRHPRHRSAYPDGDRSIRPRVDASHLSAIRDSRRERREPPFQPCFWFTEGWFRVPRRVFLPEGSRDSRALDHFCHHDCNASTKAQTLSPRDPRRAFGLATENRLLLRAAPTDHPKATDRCRRCPAPLFSDPFCTRAPQCVAECGFQIGVEVTQHLSSSLMAPVGCGDTLRTASSPCSTEGLLIRTIPRRSARTASPRCPPSSRRASMRARPVRDSDPLARGRGHRTG